MVTEGAGDPGSAGAADRVADQPCGDRGDGANQGHMAGLRSGRRGRDPAAAQCRASAATGGSSEG